MTNEKAKAVAKRVKKRLEPKSAADRGPVTVYLDKALYARFGKACEASGTSRSLVLEELMREFL
jgi:hypothetical protein